MTDLSSSPWQKALQEPTLHFVLVAVLVFAAYALMNEEEAVLELDGNEIQARLFLAELQAGQALSEDQQQAVVNSYVEEQILVAEALELELDNDARIHDILAQKMRHVLSADVIQPSDEELDAFYRGNEERYRRAATLTLDELIFNNREPVADALLALLNQGAEPNLLLQDTEGSVSDLAGATHLDLANIFSEDFADQVFAAENLSWVGPFVSNRGQHWLRIRTRREAQTPPLESITERVRLDWIASEEESRLQDEINTLRQRYVIVINEGEQE